MPNTYTFAVHGIHFVPELTAASGPLLNVPGTDYTDVAGLPQGFGKTFRGKANRQNWFHVAPPTLAEYNHSTASLWQVMIRFQTFDTAFISNIHLHSGYSGHLPQSLSGLRLQGDFTIRFEQNVLNFTPPISLTTGPLCISILVNFGARDSNIRFVDAYASFLTAADAVSR